MEWNNSYKQLLSEIIMSIIYGGFYWHKTLPLCSDLSEENLIDKIKDDSFFNIFSSNHWKKYKDGTSHSTKLKLWGKFKLNRTYKQKDNHKIIFKESDILIGIYYQIAVNRTNEGAYYIDGLKYKDFHNDISSYDFDLKLDNPLKNFDETGTRTLPDNIYSCNTYVNYGTNLPICSNCNGEGYIRCSHCNGTGLGKLEKVGNYASGNDKLKRAQCTYCYGSGRIQCQVCHGSGKLNIRSPKYQKVESFKEYQKARIIVLIKIPFSNQLIHLQYSIDEFPLNLTHAENIFEGGKVALIRESPQRVIIDNRQSILEHADETEKEIANLYSQIAYNEDDGYIAYSSEEFIKIPVRVLINSSSKKQHPIYIIENYKKKKNEYIPTTTFFMQPIK